MGDDQWALRLRCAECKHAHPTLSGVDFAHVGPIDASDTFRRILCPNCGGSDWCPPRPGRLETTSTWWKPSTWGTTQWVWRDDPSGIVPFPQKPFTLMVLPGEEESDD